MLQAGQTLRAVNAGLDYRVTRYIGGGGQGEVYEARFGTQHVAVKWYYSTAASNDQREALELLIRRGSPDNRFLWPSDLVEAGSLTGFGYIMPLRKPRFRSIVDLVKRRVDPTFQSLTTAGYQVSDSFYQLHTRGLCYRDISFGNVFFDPDKGDVLICDNDNVTVDGKAIGGILGTPRFMAPEIVRGEAAPSTKTDLFSLSVLLFYMFMVSHPLEGRRESNIRCLDVPAMNKLYGYEPLFIFDPNDRSNAPVKSYHDNAIVYWPIYPQWLRDLFTRAFTTGLHDPEYGRVRESEWRSAMVRAHDAIVYCQCGAEVFCDTEQLNSPKCAPVHCWQCKKAATLPFYLRSGIGTVMLNNNTKLFPHHVDADRMYDFGSPVAEVTRHPTNLDVWGLRNLSASNWTAVVAEGTIHEIMPGKTIRLADGLQINFGHTMAEIHC
jgi:DNA-binding helix-hairpin-helix protein with protein kinase domain